MRTRIQNEWANAYEALADLAGRGIRYGRDPEWIAGAPDSLTRLGGDGPLNNFAHALRHLSETKLQAIETLRALLEVWQLHPETRQPEMLDQILELIRDEWVDHPLLDGEPPEIDFESHHVAAVTEVGDLLRALEVANLEMLDAVRRQLEDQRTEIERNSQ